MNEQNKIKLNLKGVIIIILVFAVLAAIGIVYVLMQEKAGDNKKLEKDTNTVAIDENNTVEPTPEPVNTLNAGELDLSFLKMENNKKNIIYSPLSIRYALKLLLEGADGTTKEQIEKVIGTTELGKYKNVENVLSLANAVFIRNTFENNVKDEYVKNVKEKYDAEVTIDEFKDAKNMNTWIAKKTFNQIKDVISDEAVSNPDAAMFLINALAIDMEWKNGFDAEDTNGRDFTLEDGTIMQATMMSRESKGDDVAYYQDDNVTALAMDLKETEDSSLEFIAIMPTNENLSTYINNVTSEEISNIRQGLIKASTTSAGVNVNVPKFSTEYELKFKEELQTLGIIDAFSPTNANFLNMSEANLYVSGAIHKANIDFTEKGVKAAAVTVFGMEVSAMIPEEKEKPIDITLYKPYMYVIVDKKTNDIWFAGAVFTPNDWTKDQESYKPQS